MFEDIKIGDEVFYRPAYGLPIIKSVIRVTPKRFEVNHHVFHKDNGRLVGSSNKWSSVSVEIVTDENRAISDINERKNEIGYYLQKLHAVSIDDVDKNKLATIAEYLRKALKETK